MSAPNHTIHVSPWARDASSPSSVVSEEAAHAGMAFTLERARDLARAARRADPGQAIIILLHDGVYRRSAPLKLTAEDGGTAEAPTVWRAAEGARAVITGLQPLPAAWESRGDGRWALNLAADAATPTDFRQLFCNGRRLARTRWPAEGYHAVYGFAGEGDDNHRQSFRYLAGDVRRWENLDDVEFVVIHNWSESRLFVGHLDEDKQVVSFTGKAAYPFDFGGWNAYFVENVKEALLSPGQWYLDRREGVLYVLPPEDTSDPNAAVFEVPSADALLEVRGTADLPVRYLRFEGLGFAGTRWRVPATGYANGGGAEGPHVRPAGITFENAERCELRNGRIEATAGYAVELGNCRECSVSHVTIAEAGGGGVILFDGSDNEVADCHIHHCGLLYLGGSGIVNPTGLRTRICHNHVHDLPYCGIRGGNWNKTLEERIESNHVHHVMLVLDDGSGIFNAGIGSVIRDNLVHDCPGGRHRNAHGLYLDEFRTGVLMEGNVVFNTGSALLHLHNNYGHTIVNNIFAFGGAAQLSWTVFHGIHFGRRIQPYRHPLHTFQRNIFYWREGCLSHNLDCNRWDLATQPERIDYNVYWKAGVGDIEAPRVGRISAQQVRMGWGHGGQPGIGHDTLADWQALGMDRHSLNLDPLFEDPDHGDFRLRADSPAWTLGFHPIDLGAVGPRA